MSRIQMSVARRRGFGASAPGGSLSLNATPATLSLAQGSSTSCIITVTRTGYAGTISFVAASLPSGVTAEFSPATITGTAVTTMCTLSATGGAALIASDSVTISAFGDVGIAEATTTLSLSVVALDADHFWPIGRGVSAELPRGVTSDHDVEFDRTADVMTAAGGSGFDPCWQYREQLHGAARWAARTATRTVTSSGTAGWGEFLTFVNEFVAGTGDWEIRLPAAITMIHQDLEFGWKVPEVEGDRRLYITYVGTLPTAGVMPTTAELAACAVITGQAVSISEAFIAAWSPNCAKLTLTGVVLRPGHCVLYEAIVSLHNLSAATMADVPSQHVFDRVWIDGRNVYTGDRGDVDGAKAGLRVNGQQNYFRGCWITDIRGYGEAKGVVGYAGTRYNVWEDCYCEAVGIGFLFGGADPPGPGTGVMDPSDNLCVRVACSRKAAWMSAADGANGAGTAIGGIKNGFESKNCVRWFILNCATANTANTGQPYAMIFQCHQDSVDANAAAVRVEDIVVHNHLFQHCQNGLNTHAAVTYGAFLPTHPGRRWVFSNFLFKDLGNAFGSPGYCGRPIQFNGGLHDILFDRWTMLFPTGVHDIIRVNDGGGRNINLQNFAGNFPAIYGQPNGIDSRGVACLANYCDTLSSEVTLQGNAFWLPGHPDYSGGSYPGTTFYNSAAEMGLDLTTGAITGAGADDGVDGTPPGVDFSAFTPGLASVVSWATSR